MQFANRYDLPMILSINDFYEDAVPYLTNSKLTEPYAAFRQKGRFREIADFADIITSTNKKAGDYLAAAGVKRKFVWSYQRRSGAVQQAKRGPGPGKRGQIEISSDGQNRRYFRRQALL